MTNNQHGQVPAIQRYKIGYHSDEWGVRSLSPTGIYDDAGPWVRYEDHAAVITALRTTHVQNPAEIEHVAGDVSKNGAEVNTPQQPAPATQKLKEQICISDTNQSAACAAGSVGTTSDAQTTRSTHDAPATQPSPTAQAADSVLVEAQQPATSAACPVDNNNFDHQTAADVLNGKTVSDEAMRKFVAVARWAHDDRVGLRATLLSVRGELASREAEIALLKKALMDAEAPQPSPTAQADSQPAPDNEAILSAARNWGDVQQYNRTDGKGTEHRIVFSMPKRAAHFARELLAARKQGGA